MPTTITAGAQDTSRYVYLYRKPDGTPFYVGKGTGWRFRQHYLDAKAGRKLDTFVKKVCAGLIKKGLAPRMEFIARGLDNEFAALIEQEAISKYGRIDLGTGTLANCTAGGDGAEDIAPQAKARRDASLAAIGVKTRFVKGARPHNYGVPSAPEAVERMRASKTGTKASEATKAKMRQWQQANNRRRGTVHTDEAKALISAAKKGCTPPPGTFEKWVCDCCGKAGVSIGAAKRWHFDNCKFKEKI